MEIDKPSSLNINRADHGAGRTHAARWSARVGLFLFWTAVFAIVYCQAPLYFSNQNQYFVHGMAHAGFGHLDQDWLANTQDPTPIFSQLVTVSTRFLPQGAFYLYYALILGVYFASLVGIFNVVARSTPPMCRLTFAAIMLLIHSGAARACSARLLGVDYPWYLQAGVAGQYVLGPMLQPSTFGVLLLVSLVAFARGRPLLAVTCSALGAVLHATYLPAAAILTLAYMLSLVMERRVWTAMMAGLWALVLVLPMVIYHWNGFGRSAHGDFAAAQAILAHFRLPHHAEPRLWFDGVAVLQLLWIGAGALCARGTKLFAVLAVSLLLAGALTLLQIATDSSTLALLFPWRISVILVPAATALVFSRLVLLLRDRLEGCSVAGRRLLWAANGTVIAVLVLAGFSIMHFGLAFQSRDEELPMMDFVRKRAARGQLYLIPALAPDLAKSTRGSFKSDFKPLATLQSDARFIPLDLQRFRLLTGVPIFVDFKSIPYRADEVLAWRERIHLNEQFFRSLEAKQLADALPQLRKHGITHVVTRPDQALDGSHARVDYQDKHYCVWELLNEK